MHDCLTGHIVVGGRLHSCMFVQLRDGGTPPLTVLEREGKGRFWLMPPGLGLGTSRAYSSETPHLHQPLQQESLQQEPPPQESQ